jgi:hypothetical protein
MKSAKALMAAAAAALMGGATSSAPSPAPIPSSNQAPAPLSPYESRDWSARASRRVGLNQRQQRKRAAQVRG